MRFRRSPGLAATAVGVAVSVARAAGATVELELGRAVARSLPPHPRARTAAIPMSTLTRLTSFRMTGAALAPAGRRRRACTSCQPQRTGSRELALPGDELGEQVVEFGFGVGGEPGVDRRRLDDRARRGRQPVEALGRLQRGDRPAGRVA